MENEGNFQYADVSLYKCAQLPDILFLIGYSLYIFMNMTTQITTLDWIRLPLLFITIALLILPLLMTEYYSHGLFFHFQIIFIVISIISSFFSGREYLLITILLALNCVHLKKYTVWDICQFNFIIKFLIACFVVAMYLFGLTTQEIYTRVDATIRTGLGFGHPNQAGAIAFSLVLQYCFLKRGKLNLFEYIVLLGGSYYLYTLTNSRTFFYCIMIGLAIVLINQVFQYKLFSTYLFQRAMVIAPIAFAGITIFLFILFPMSDFSIYLNSITSGRVWYCNNVFKTFGITYFGQGINVEHVNLYLDNAYLYILIRSGALVFGLLLISFVLTIQRGINLYNGVFAFSWVIFCFYGIFENAPIYPAMNFLIPFIFTSRKELSLGEYDLRQRQFGSGFRVLQKTKHSDCMERILG